MAKRHADEMNIVLPCTYPYIMIMQPSSSRVKPVMYLYCCWLLSCELMPWIAIFLLCLPQ